jgi:hypothetical protein
VASDVVIYVYDVTNSVLITPSVTGLPKASGTYQITFDSTTSTSYRLIFHVATTNASAYNLFFDSFVVGPGTVVQGAAIGPWISYTQTLNAVTTAPTKGTIVRDTAWYRRVGDTMEIQWNYEQSSAGTGGSGVYIFPLPLGLTIDTTKALANGDNSETVMGNGIVATSGDGQAATTRPLTVDAYNSTGFSLTATNDTSGALNTTRAHLSSTFNGFSNATYIITVQAKIPLAEWAGSGSVNLAQNDVEYAYSTATTTTAGGSDTTSFGYGPAGVQFNAINSTTAGSSTTNYTVRFLTPIQVTDDIVLEFSDDSGVTWSEVAAQLASGRFNQSDSIYGVYIAPSTSTDVIIRFGNQGRLSTNATYAGSGASWAGIAATVNRWRVKKSKAGSAVGFGLAANGSSGLIDYYRMGTTSTTFSFNGSGGTSSAVTVRYTRIGNVVTIFIPNSTATAGTGSTTYTSNTAIDSWARPARVISSSAFVTNNNSVITSPFGRFNLGTDGIFTLNRDNSSTAFTNSATAGVNADISFSYVLD